MDFNIEIRRKQLENLDQFMSSSRDRVDSILEYLGWSAQKITENQKETVKCMVNPSHRIPASSAATHMQNCAWRKENYATDDLPLSEPNPMPGSSIIIDDMTKINVLNGALAKNPLMKTGWRSHEPVPKTSNRLLATFTPDERLALYDYSVIATQAPAEVPEFNMTKPKIEERHNLTVEELKALERDAKRRRIKYKSKCVHTNRKSTTEVLREVIDSQMEQYEDYLRDEEDVDSTTDHANDNNKEQCAEEASVEYSNNKDYSSNDNNREYNREQTLDYNTEYTSQDNEVSGKESSKMYTNKSHSKEQTRDGIEQQDNNITSKKQHQLMVEGELGNDSNHSHNNETASPRSSRSQNSYRSQESRPRARPRTPTEPENRSSGAKGHSRERSRSIDKRHGSRYDTEYRHHSTSRSRRYDDRNDRDFRDYDRKYRDRRHRSREQRYERSRHRDRSDR